jgi:hypothetical protein
VAATGDPAYEGAVLKRLTDPLGHLSWTERERNAWADARAVQGEMKAMSDTGNASLLP